MHFCNKCSNMLYISLAEENSNEIIYYCRNCGDKDNNNIINTSHSITKSHFNKSNSKYFNTINPYTKLDPTLPRINTIKCPNIQCKSNTNTDIPREVIYIRYDDINMKYIYLCCNCDYSWTTNNSF